MSDSLTSDAVARRLGQIEHLLNEVLERQERNSVKVKMALERAIEKVGLELSDHRNVSESTGFYVSERVEEKELDDWIFQRARKGWRMVSLSPIRPLDDNREHLFLAVFRQSAYQKSRETDTALESGK